MKKEIIIIMLLIYSANSFAQEKYDQSGALLPQYNNTQKANPNPGNQNEKPASIFEQNGTLKAGEKLPYKPAELNQKEIPAVQYNSDGSVGNAKQETPKVNEPKKKLPEEDIYIRKTNQNIPVDYSKGAKEDYKRKSDQNIPVDYSKGAKEDYKRSAVAQPINQSGSSKSTGASTQTIADADKNLSDVELNQKYPGRNINPNAIKPSSGTNNQASDIEAQKKMQTGAKKIVQQSAPTQDNNKLSDREIQNRRSK